MKLCLAASAGGHLAELAQLEGFYKKREHFFVSDARSNALELAGKKKIYFVACPRRNPLKLAVNFIQSLKVFLNEKPDVIVSTGADTAVPICLIAKLFGKKVVFIESFARIREGSLSAKIMYPFADRFFVQWPQTKAVFRRAEFAGSVF